jgi:hypothetical protein
MGWIEGHTFLDFRMPMVHPLGELAIAAPQKKLVVEVGVTVVDGVLVHEEDIRSFGL